MVCKVGILPYDGNKQLFFAHKLFYGQDPVNSTIPVKFNKPTNVTPQQCNLMLEMHVKIVLPRYRQPNEYTKIPQQQFLKYIQMENSWIYWFHKTMQNIMKLPDTITLEKFIKLPFRTKNQAKSTRT